MDAMTMVLLVNVASLTVALCGYRPVLLVDWRCYDMRLTVL